MSWRDELRRVRLSDGRELIGASFRGVPFFVARSERAGGGRRTVTHQYPQRDDPFIEDLGRSAVRFSVEGYVLGDEYLQERDALLDALDAPGAGELVHPYYGIHQAMCDDSLRVSESSRDGGIATFQIVFLRVSVAAAPPPVEEPDLDAQTAEAADEAQTATSEELVATYDVDDEPAFALESLEAELKALVEGIRSTLEPLASTAQEAALVAKEADDIVAAAATLIRTPAQMLLDVRSAITTMQQSALVPARSLVSALLAAYATTSVTPPNGTTATRDKERDNLDALGAALRRTMVIEASRAIVDAEYEVLVDATTDASDVADALDEQADTAGDIAYPALVHLRARVLRAVPGNATLARVVKINRPVSIPSLVLSHELHGSIEAESDIVARNRARHPLFLAGELEVLSDV